MIKRFVDLVASICGLVILFPIFIMLSLLIRLSTPGPAFYMQKRVGKHGVQFNLFKFRTMTNKSENLGRETTGFNDPRITKIGKFLRKYKLDEMPQLINVIRGEMSLVGPRPEIPFYVSKYGPDDQIVLTVKPGITDPCSLRLSNLEEIMDSRGSRCAQEFYENEILPYKLKLQKEYVLHQSNIVDIKIIIKTLLKIIGIK
jgi:lipopolysaccharide/colanic/teichoic acid biosynthesis glycosyltransferase